ncbi:hypothetical protein GOODEAATRI_010249 [Goodea atripinnis]|uniref:Uncharacterized protein n=1 Tax=Goodea atripinnis TaxID=208336 RepID=A0ABV0MGK9_9TELE
MKVNNGLALHNQEVYSCYFCPPFGRDVPYFLRFYMLILQSLIVFFAASLLDAWDGLAALAFFPYKRPIRFQQGRVFSCCTNQWEAAAVLSDRGICELLLGELEGNNEDCKHGSRQRQNYFLSDFQGDDYCNSMLTSYIERTFLLIPI